MSFVRNIKTLYWTDAKVLKMSPSARYLYLYLITSPHSNVAGCYEIAKPMISTETGLPYRVIEECFSELDKLNILRYCNETAEVLLLNFPKHNWGNSPKVRSAVRTASSFIKEDRFRDYVLALVDKTEEADSEKEAIKYEWLRVED